MHIPIYNKEECSMAYARRALDWGLKELELSNWTGCVKFVIEGEYDAWIVYDDEGTLAFDIFIRDRECEKSNNGIGFLIFHELVHLLLSEMMFFVKDNNIIKNKVMLSFITNNEEKICNVLGKSLYYKYQAIEEDE